MRRFEALRFFRSSFTVLLIAGSICKLFWEDQLIQSHEHSEHLQSSTDHRQQAVLQPILTLSTLERPTLQQRKNIPLKKHSYKPGMREITKTTVTSTTPALILESHDDSTNSSSSSSSNIASVTVLPPWMHDYFEWHRTTRQRLDKINAASYKYLVVRCLHRNKKCSGASDRLQALPTAIRLAAETQRLLFYQWERPAPLTEFLVPPASGLDWRLPAWLDEHLHMHNKTVFFLSDDKNMARLPAITQTVVCVKAVRGSRYYDHRLIAGEPSFTQVYAAVWNSVFVPAPPVQARIVQQLHALGLQRGQYVAAHVRSLYVYNTTHTAEEEHAIDCAQLLTQVQEERLQQQEPIYFSSDSATTTRLAVAYAAVHSNVTVVARTTNNTDNKSEPLHLDRGRDFLQPGVDQAVYDAADYYDVFVDFYLLAMARCVVYGAGGYGHWASLMSQDQSCAVNHRTVVCAKLL